MSRVAALLVVAGLVLLASSANLPVSVARGGQGPDAPAAVDPRQPDFDADGYADLAIGAPHENIGRARDAGAVSVIHGSASGLAVSGNQWWRQGGPGMDGRPEDHDLFGSALAAADFDGDGFTDLAIGAHGEKVAGRKRAGAVHVLYGSAWGLSAERDRILHQDVPGMPDRAEAGDGFGFSLAAGDFDADGFADLAVGMRFEDVGRIRDAGAVAVIRGSSSGLTPVGSQLWHQDSPGIAGAAEAGEEMGWALATGDFDGDGHDDLAIGAAYDDHHANRDGVVHVLFGSLGGLSSRGSQVWSQDSPGVADRSEERDQFGQTLAAGDFDADGYDDLAVGVWHEDFCRICNEGAVHVLRGSRRGLTATGSQLWTQDSPGVLDSVDPFDQFGQSLVAADLDGDGYSDLAIGSPREGPPGWDVNADQGAVNVLRGSARGLTGRGSQLWSQDSPGIAESSRRLDLFGLALGAADFDADGYDDLAVGVRYEDGRRRDSGVVHVIRGSARGLTSRRDQLWSQDTPGMADRAERGDGFGWALSTRHGASGTPGDSPPGYWP
jgi:hypothetical protein